jgi:hypothetical protein
MMASLRLLTVLALLGITCPSPAQTRVTVSQLEQFLHSKSASKESDAQLAKLLGTVTLSEQLTPSTLTWIVRTATPGPQTTEQLRLLASSSIFKQPPPSELPNTPPPNVTTQQQIIASARKYVTDLLHSFPDFLAVRTTLSFDDALQPTGRRKQPPEKATLQFVRQTHREIGYRKGMEIIDSTSNRSPDAPGLTTWGEFGPILKIVLGDSFQGSVQWSRWQRSETGAELAVFQYAIPKPASHYLIDFCCYRISKNDPTFYTFRDHPAYHGELYILLSTAQSTVSPSKRS